MDGSGVPPQIWLFSGLVLLAIAMAAAVTLVFRRRPRKDFKPVPEEMDNPDLAPKYTQGEAYGGDLPVEELITRLNGTPPRDCRDLLDGLASRRTAKAVNPIIRKALEAEREDSIICLRWAIEALGDIGHPAAEPYLEKMSDHKLAGIREMAVVALAQLGLGSDAERRARQRQAQEQQQAPGIDVAEFQYWD